ncbi:MAG: redoxin domain-containing protein [Chloroflexi bacterium]|nr:redoxin domain-containing protein [Chloroflexota bacterium]
MTQFGLDADEFRQEDAEIIGCSIDTAWTLEQFDKATNFGWNLASDFNKEIGELYGVLNPELPSGMRGVHRRSVFVIDRQGKIRYAWESQGGALPNDEEILAEIRKC